MIPDESFEKKEHILKSKDFNAAYKKGFSCKKGSLVLYCAPNNSKFNRLGFSISASNFKLATKRNRIKRILREAYRKNKKLLRVGFDLVIVVRKGLPNPISYKYLEDHFLELAKFARLSA